MNTDDVLRTLLEMLTYGNRRFATRYAEELLERLKGDGPMPDPEVIMDFACGQLTRTCPNTGPSIPMECRSSCTPFSSPE